jgi:hypothetical protein
MHNNEEPFLQMYIIGVLLALIGATVVIDHAEWFSGEYASVLNRPLGTRHG